MCTLRRNSSGQHHFYHEPHLLPHQTHFHIIAGLQNYFSAPAQLGQQQAVGLLHTYLMPEMYCLYYRKAKVLYNILKGFKSKTTFMGLNQGE